MNAFVYILRCSDGSYYVGSTRDSLEERGQRFRRGDVRIVARIELEVLPALAPGALG